MNTNMSPDEIKQYLLELHYDLLDDAEAGAWRNRIATEPEVALAWAETLRLAGKLADAAKIEGAALTQLDKEAAKQTASETNATSDPSKNGKPHSTVAQALAPNVPTAESKSVEPKRTPEAISKRWWATSIGFLAVSAACGLIVISLRFMDKVPARPAPVLAMQAAPTLEHEAVSPNEFEFITKQVHEVKRGGFSAMPVVPAMLNFSVLAGNTTLFSGEAECSDNGTARVVVPSELPIPEGARLRVDAKTTSGNAGVASVEIPLEPTRCLTFLTTDRPVYRPGEYVFFRSLTLNRRSLSAKIDVPIRFELIDPSGAVVPGAFVEGITDRGVGNGSFQIPSTAPGGPYTLVAKSLDGFFPEEHHDFDVRAYRVPRLKKELELQRRSYGPGETVEADFSAERAEGGMLAGAVVRITAKVDDEVVYKHKAVTSPAGTLAISFQLPEHISVGNAQLSVAVDDGSVLETKTKTIPIQLGKVAVDFYPEGGYLVGGLENRIYFAARNTLGDPIHLRGEILSRSGESVATIETKRDGMGRFSFKPESGQRYSLKVIEPVDVTNAPRLPTVVKDLPVLDTGTGVFAAKEPISLNVRSRRRIPVIVQAVCRGQLVGQKEVKLDRELSVVLPVRDDANGVIRVTILDAATTPPMPLVERLVFRRDDKQLNVKVVEGKSALQRSPGEPMRLTLQVTDENDNPAAAVLGVSVVDDAAISLQENEQPTLSTHFLLTSEVQSPEDLEHANFYLSNEDGAAESLDLLLGTQGWRRFVSGSPNQPNTDFREQLVRLLELDGDRTTKKAAQTYRSHNVFENDWRQYQTAMTRAWKNVVTECRVVLLVLLGLWCVSVLLKLMLMRLRRAPLIDAAALLLVGSLSLSIIGCGAKVNEIIVGNVDSADRAPMSQESEQAAMKMEAAMEGGMEAPEEAMGAGADDSSRLVLEKPTSASQDTLPAANMPAISGGTPPQQAPADSSTKQMFDDPAAGARHAAELLQSVSPNRQLTQDQLKRLLAARGLDAETLADQLMDELRFPIREYAHKYDKSKSDVRQDFTETLCWQPLVITDSTGKATVRFDLSDSVTSFRVHVDGHTDSGRIGSGQAMVTSRIPFQLEPKMPLEVTTGDQIELPVAVINTTNDAIGVTADVQIDSSLQLIGDAKPSWSVAAGERTRQYLTLDVKEGSAETDAFIQIAGVGGRGDQKLSDKTRRTVHISPAGYPVSDSIAGVLNGRQKIRLPIAKQIVPGSLAVTIRAYPSPLSDLMSGVDSILREPHGCFEQTSATNYPNAMALSYMQRNNIASPAVTRKATGMLDRGYGKLTSFECQKRGYEWFGHDPGHEALSAFGLMQFTDMKKIMDVDQQMMVRTRSWLMKRRDGQGGFNRNPRHLHVWSVDQNIVNAYVLWAISEADVAANQAQRTASELAAELEQLNTVAQSSDDAYLVGLSAAALMNAKRTSDGNKLLQKLSELQVEDGSLDGKTTVTSSGGISRKVETTAIATLAWLKSKTHLPNARKAAKWLTQNRRGGGFGSTQATVLALKALVAMSDHSASKAGGKLQVRLGGNVIGEAKLPSDPRGGETVEITGLGQQFDIGDAGGEEPEIELVAKDSDGLSFTIDVRYNAITPNSHKDCPVKITSELTGELRKGKSVAAGKTLTVKAQLENTTNQGQPMTVAIVGLPGGLEPSAEELGELMDQGKYDYYELRGREVIFYWRTVEPNAQKDISFTVTAAIPGTYTGPASRAYLYYTAEQKSWTEPLKVRVRRTEK